MTTTRNDASAYARIKRRCMLIDLATGLTWLAFFYVSGWSEALAGWWSAWIASEPLVIMGYMAAFGAAHYVVMLPLHFHTSFTLEHRFGLSRMTLKAWVVREAKQLAVSGVLGLLLIEGLYALLRHAPSTWPIWATLGWVGFSIVLARVFPTVLLPIFYKTTPLQDQALVERLLALCHRAGLDALGVFRFDLGAETRKANAALAGLGRTRRVLLADTLIAEFTPEEIEGVLAHELAHHRYHHIRTMLVISAAGSWIAFTLTAWAGRYWAANGGVRSLDDIAGFPIVMLWLSVLGLLGMPLQNGLSRYFEWQADHFAVEMTKQSQPFADALRRLAQLNLADPNPPRWVVWMFYDHPPISERIAAAERSAA